MQNNLQKLRKQNKLSQNDLAILLGVTRQAVSLYEQGKRQLKDFDIDILTKYFNVSKNHLLGAYSKKEIARIGQQEYKRQYDSKKKKVFHIAVSKLSYITVDDYFISTGVIPYDIKQEAFLLTEQQVNDLDFWINNFEPIFNTTVIKWLLEKPTLNANEADVLEAINNAMDSVINKSSTVFVNPWLSRNLDNISDEQYFAKRLKFINEHVFYDKETMDNGHVEFVPYFDWNKTNNS